MSESVQRGLRPTAEDLQREARRIAQLRRVTHLRDVSRPEPDPRFGVRRDLDPDPKQAA